MFSMGLDLHICHLHQLQGSALGARTAYMHVAAKQTALVLLDLVFLPFSCSLQVQDVVLYHE